MNMPIGLLEQVETLNRQLSFPEVGTYNGHALIKKEAWLAFLDLRQLLEREVIPALYRLREMEKE